MGKPRSEAERSLAFGAPQLLHPLAFILLLGVTPQQDQDGRGAHKTPDPGATLQDTYSNDTKILIYLFTYSNAALASTATAICLPCVLVL